MQPDPISQAYLDRFEAPLLTKAGRLQAAGCVKSLTGHARQLEGKVEFGGETFVTVLSRPNGAWTGSVSPSGQAGQLALAVTMLEWLNRPTSLREATSANQGEDMRRKLERKLGRPLEVREVEYLTKIEKRHERYRQEKAVYDHDLVRLQPRWPVETTEPLRLWPSPPASILEFWNYIAYAFAGRKLAYPVFLNAVTDLETTREKMRAWESDKEMDFWRGRIGEMMQRPATPHLLRAQCRLLITPHEARLQISGRDPAPAPDHWDDITEAMLQDWLRASHEGRLQLDADSQLLWLAFIEHFGPASPAARILLEENLHAAWLGALFTQLEAVPALKNKLVTLDGTPFLAHEQPLQWTCEEETKTAADSERSDDYGEEVLPQRYYELKLVHGDGSPLHSHLRYLPAPVPRYLTHEEVFTGPPFWEQGTEVHDRYRLPAGAAETMQGINFLYQLGVKLPAALLSRLHDVRFEVTLRVIMLTQDAGTGSEHVLVTATGRDAENTTEAYYQQDMWRFRELQAAGANTLLRYDHTVLDLVPPQLTQLGVSYDPAQEAYKIRVTKTFPQRFFDWMKQLPPELTLDLADPRLQSLRHDPIRAKVRFDLQSSGLDWFDLRVLLDIGDLELSAIELRALVAARGDYVRMKDGMWRRLEIDLDPSQQEAVNHLGLDVFDLSGEKHRMHLMHLSDAAVQSVFDPAMWAQLCARLAQRKLEVTPEVPAALQASLRPYQIKGFHFLAYLSSNSFGGILADDMGLGKTVQSLCWLLWLRQMEEERGQPPRPALVICPKSVLDVWAAEVVKFAPSLRCQVLRDKSELNLAPLLNNGVDILAMNYAQLRGCEEQLRQVNWLAAVLDEGQQIKNPDSKAAKAARALQSDHRLILTGTPIENRLLDIWSLMAFAMPGVLGDRAYFGKRFDRRKDGQAQERLSARLRPFLLRRAKKHVLEELPPRTEEEVFCTMGEAQTELYREELKRIQDSLIARMWNRNDSQMLVLQGLMRLRQICCHPALVDKANPEADSAKMTALFYLLDQLREEGHKVLVFSQFVTMLDLIKARLESEARPYHYLTGQTQNRGEVVDSFQTSTDPSVFLLSLRAGGSGLNLTAASYVVMYDPWWNPAVEAQAIDRTHRIGQKNHVIAYRLFIRDSVEEKIRILQQRKRSLSENILGEESFSKNLDEEDLKFLFEWKD